MFMVKGFWEKLDRPIMALAPMDDVTDAAFRRLIAKYGKPDVFWTEFVSADGLQSEGRERLLIDFWYTKAEHPIIAQIFGTNPENYYKSAQLIKELGFDGVDINMGCPEKNTCKAGAGAAMVKNPKLAQEVIQASKEGAGNLPVTVKIRSGYNKHEIETWIPQLLKAEPKVITLHARTRKQMSKVPADWGLVKRTVEIRDEIRKDVLIIGNGDVQNLKEAEQRVKETGADGVMIGRGIFGNPWLFNKEVDRDDLDLEERFQVMLEHTFLYELLFKNGSLRGSGFIKNFHIMRKHFKAYVSGFDNAREFRMKLMKTESAQEVVGIVKKEYPGVDVDKAFMDARNLAEM